MVGGRSRGSSGMVLAVVLLMVMAAQTKGKSQLSIVEDIDKSLENILRDVQTLYEYIDPSTTSRETTPEGASTPGVTSETSSEFSVSTTDSSSTDFSNAPSDTTTTIIPTSTTATTTIIPTSTTATTTIIPTSTTATTTIIPTSTTDTTTTIPISTTSTTTAITTTTTSTTTIIPTSTTATTTTIPTTTTSTTTASTTTTTSETTTVGPPGPKSNARVKRRNLLSLATLDDVLSGWVDPRSSWLEDKMSTETSNGTSDVTSDVTSDIPSLESTIPTSTAVTTPVSDIIRLETALNETHEVVTQVAAGIITEDQVRQMQAAEADVKDVTESPDEALMEKLQNDRGYLDTLIEKIKNDQVTITETLDKLKKRKTGIIVGSVLGSLVLVALVAAGTVSYVRRNKKLNTGVRATAEKRRQSAAASSHQQMVELRTDHGMEDPYPPDEFRPHSRTPPNPLIPHANNNPPESSRIPGRESPMQVGEMRTEPGIANPGYVEELPPRPVVPPKPRNHPSTFDDFGVSPSQIRIGQEPSRADFVPSEQTHYIDELNYRLAPRERQVRPIRGNSPTEPSRRSRRDRSPRHHQHHHRHPRNHDHRMRHRNDHHDRRTPSMPPPDYTIPRGKHQSPDNFIARRPHSQKQLPPRSPYEFEAPRSPSAPPEFQAPRPERNRSDIRRPYGPEDLY